VAVVLLKILAAYKALVVLAEAVQVHILQELLVLMVQVAAAVALELVEIAAKVVMVLLSFATQPHTLMPQV
jgi:hypothetical protein